MGMQSLQNRLPAAIMDSLSHMGLGTAAIGRPQYINIRQEADSYKSLKEFAERGTALLQTAYDLGIRYFDTAPGYGMAEQLVLDWVRDTRPKGITIATKWGYTYTANFDPNAKVHEVKEHSLHKLNEQWEVSRALLPNLKYYQIHSATFDSGVLDNGEVLERLHQLKETHGVEIGLTASGHDQVAILEKALSLEVQGTLLFDMFQVTYNVFDQSLGELAKDIPAKLVIKEALANGRVFPNDHYSHYADTYALLLELSEKYGVGIDAIALRFCLDSVPIFKVLSGAATKDHLNSNLQVSDFVLEEEEVNRIRLLATDTKKYWKERQQLAWN